MQEIFKNIGLRELRMLLGGLGLIVTAGVVAAYVIPAIKAVAAANDAVNVLVEASLDGGELDQHLQDRHRKIEELNFRLHGDMASLPVRQVESYVIGRLQKVSWNNNIELVSVEPALGERVQIFQEMLFNIRLVGEYRDLYHWISEAKSELGYVVVKEYGLTRRDNVDENPLLIANLSLASYRAVK